MGIGRYREKVEFFTIQALSDTYGGQVEGVELQVMTIFTRGKQIQASRSDKVSQINWDVTYDFHFRFYSSVTIGRATFLRYNGDVFTIQSLELINERNLYWKVRAVKNNIDISSEGGTPFIGPSSLKYFNYSVIGGEQIFLKDELGNIAIGATIIGFWKTINLQVVNIAPVGNQVQYNSVTGELIFPETLDGGELITAIFI